jgi:hypothetical protein
MRTVHIKADSTAGAAKREIARGEEGAELLAASNGRIIATTCHDRRSILILNDAERRIAITGLTFSGARLRLKSPL